MGDVICVDCGGSGVDEMDDEMYCPLCGGDGEIEKSVADSVLKSWEKHGHYKDKITPVVEEPKEKV